MPIAITSLESEKRVSRTRVISAVLTAIAFIASTLILWATRGWGIGITADSTVYIGAARSLLSSGTLQDADSIGRPIPLVHQAPLLPILLATISRIFRIDPVSSARWLSAILFGVNTALLGVIAWRFVKSAWIGLAAALLALIATPMIDYHLMALSEPLYLFFSLSTLFLLLHYSSDFQLRWLLFAGAVSAFAFLTRYAGIALVGTGFFALLFLCRRNPARAIRHPLTYLLIACLPMAAWLLRNLALADSVSDYSMGKAFGAHTTFGAVALGLDTVSAWILPGFVPRPLRIGIAMASILSLIIICYWQRFRNARATASLSWLDLQRAKLLGLASLFIACNLLLLFVVASSVDETLRLDDRILVPLLCPAILLLLCSLQLTSASRSTSNRLWIVPALIIGLSFVTNSVRSTIHLLAAAHSGSGYGAKRWRNSPVIRQLQLMPDKIPIYTTLPSCVRFLTARPARLLPNTYDSRTGRENLDYRDEISRMRSESRSPGIAVAYFKGDSRRPFLYESEMERYMDLHLVARDDTGSLYLSSTALENRIAVKGDQETRETDRKLHLDE